MPSSFRPVWPVRTRPARSQSPQVSPTFQPSPWEALSGLWDLCGVWRLFTVKVQFKFQEFPGCPRVRTLGSHCHELGLILAW